MNADQGPISGNLTALPGLQPRLCHCFKQWLRVSLNTQCAMLGLYMLCSHSGTKRFPSRLIPLIL